MRQWNLGFTDPLQLTLAADARFAHPQYPRDTIWELRAEQGAPPALALTTTFGLRARAMRLFPMFFRANKALSDPADFAAAPRVIRVYPNLISVQYSPYSDISVCADYWALSSDVIAGRLAMVNLTAAPAAFQMQWLAILNPLTAGMGMRETNVNLQTILTGQFSDQTLVFMGTGAPDGAHSSYPGLAYSLEFEPHGARSLQWACACADDVDAAADIARQAAERTWEPEIARIELTNASQMVDIQTGNPEWDAALMLSQRAAALAFMGPSAHLPRPSFVLARLPEQGFSIRGSGEDYNALWNGQTALDVWYLAGLLLPGQPERVQGLIDNFLAVQSSDGFIDWKPGLAGQRSQRLAQPLLASVAWQVYEHLDNFDWIAKVFPHLSDFFRLWFSPEHDRDQDGYPEWEHPYQCGLDSIPLFNPGDPESLGVEVRWIESPALAGMLFQEAQALERMAALLDQPEPRAWLQQIQERLIAALAPSWDPERGIFSYQDSTSHSRFPGVVLSEFSQPGTVPVKTSFQQPTRLVLKIQSPQDATHTGRFILHGSGVDGPLHEEIPVRAVQWLHGSGRYTTQNMYLKVKEIIARQVMPGDVCTLSSVPYDSEDLSLFLPLWAGMASPVQAAEMASALHERYQRPYGLTLSPAGSPYGGAAGASQIHLPWNRMIIEGLIQTGFRDQAAAILIGNLKAVSRTLAEKKNFQSYYQAENGAGGGELGVLSGLAPVNTVLACLGVKVLTSQKVILQGRSPISLPITVQYRGTTIEFLPTQTIIHTRLGKTVVITDEERHEIVF